MAQVPYSVAEAFRDGRHARSGTFVSVGDAVYSYALKLASRAPDGTITMCVDPREARKRSVTTARHLAALLSVVRGFAQ